MYPSLNKYSKLGIVCLSCWAKFWRPNLPDTLHCSVSQRLFTVLSLRPTGKLIALLHLPYLINQADFKDDDTKYPKTIKRTLFTLHWPAVSLLYKWRCPLVYGLVCFSGKPSLSLPVSVWPTLFKLNHFDPFPGQTTCFYLSILHESTAVCSKVKV